MLLHKGDAGTDVGTIQQALIESGYSVAEDELAAEVFGATTELAVEALQARSTYLGKPLAVDGMVGPETWYVLTHPGEGQYTAPGWSYDANDARPSVREVVQAAVSEIGVHENPPHSNRGPRIDLYTAPVMGIPWCAAFLSWVYKRSQPQAPFGRILSANGIFTWGKNAMKLLNPVQAVVPAPADIFVILRGRDGAGLTHGHCGLIVGQRPDGLVCTVEGNCSDAVRGVVRDRGTFTALVRPIPML